MKKTSRTIVFFGNEQLASGLDGDCPVIKSLYNDGYDIPLLVLNNTRQISRKQKIQSSLQFANEQNIPVLSPDKLSDIKSELVARNPSIGILVAYGKIIPKSIIDLFPFGIINIHPSLLPKHRGPTPIESAILNNDKTTGVSIMRLTPDMDAGPVYKQQTVNIAKSDTKFSLAQKLQKLGAEMLTDLLPRILSGDIPPTPQNHSKATYDKLIKKQDGLIDWNKPAEIIEREIRGYLGWPGSKTTIGDIEVTLTSAKICQPQNNKKSHAPGKFLATSDRSSIKVTTGNGCLCIDRLIPSGKREMTAREFLLGNKL